jgi:hypothetical protein
MAYTPDASGASDPPRLLTSLDTDAAGRFPAGGGLRFRAGR